MRFAYDAHGRLAQRVERGLSTRYAYDASGFLAQVLLPGGQCVTYDRDAGGLLRRTLLDGRTMEAFAWLDGLRLKHWRDVFERRSLEFHYAQDRRVPHALTVHDGCYSYDLALGADQVGTIKTVADDTGYLIKELRYDSFGNQLDDSNPGFHLPLGFAGGIRDRHTGLVRFGWRYYMPEAGRFTAPDPARWTGGDPDLYDYCVDDPIGKVDPQGLEPGWMGGLWDSFTSLFSPGEAQAAELVTDMGAGTTTFDPRPEDPDGKPLTIPTRNVVTRNSDPGANDPFTTDDVRVIQKMPGDKQISFGPNGAYIDTYDHRGRDIHGGGSCNKTLEEATKPRQQWCPTQGCTRGQNEDVINMGKAILEWQKNTLIRKFLTRGKSNSSIMIDRRGRLTPPS